jgi:hypothetical protein
MGCPSASSIPFTLLVQTGISCFPNQLLSLFLDGLPFCEFHPLHAIGSNRYQLLPKSAVVSLPGWAALLRVPSPSRYWFKQVSAAFPISCCLSSWMGCPSSSSIPFTLLVQTGISCFPNQLLSRHILHDADPDPIFHFDANPVPDPTLDQYQHQKMPIYMRALAQILHILENQKNFNFSSQHCQFTMFYLSYQCQWLSKL